jgi:hypothetical protein
MSPVGDLIGPVVFVAVMVAIAATTLSLLRRYWKP